MAQNNKITLKNVFEAVAFGTCASVGENPVYGAQGAGYLFDQIKLCTKYVGLKLSGKI